MNTVKGSKLVNDFVESLTRQAGLSVLNTTFSKNVFEYRRRNNVLLYIKGRFEDPLRWGVTGNVIRKLQAQKTPWAVILLFKVYDQGFFLTQNEVEYCIRNVWPLAQDGDYKPSPGSYLLGKHPIKSIESFIESIETISKKTD